MLLYQLVYLSEILAFTGPYLLPFFVQVLNFKPKSGLVVGEHISRAIGHCKEVYALLDCHDASSEGGKMQMHFEYLLKSNIVVYVCVDLLIELCKYKLNFTVNNGARGHHWNEYLIWYDATGPTTAS
ncbi:hypothetical protein M5K25_017882 [Dendrobium thyrsiflorum]|uniref:Uncharacterized protein n=1 Tax=Dendrobium thyrsiflorum TaxID=117978 RepID=A0ABD0UGP7_DENTH